MTTTYSKLTPELDTPFNDTYTDISITDKRWIRVGEKTFQKTGKYFFLKLFKKNTTSGVWERTQYISLSATEWSALCDSLSPAQNASPPTSSVSKEAPTESTGNSPQKKRFKLGATTEFVTPKSKSDYAGASAWRNPFKEEYVAEHHMVENFQQFKNQQQPITYGKKDDLETSPTMYRHLEDDERYDGEDSQQVFTQRW